MHGKLLSRVASLAVALSFGILAMVSMDRIVAADPWLVVEESAELNAGKPGAG